MFDATFWARVDSAQKSGVMVYHPQFKVCPNCGQRAVLSMVRCGRCMAVFPSVNPQPQPVPPAPAFVQQPVQYDFEMQELGRQYVAAKSTYTLTLWLGFLCLWPLWIVTYLEHNKMQRIKSKVAQKGVDPDVFAAY